MSPLGSIPDHTRHATLVDHFTPAAGDAALLLATLWLVVLGEVFSLPLTLCEKGGGGVL